MLTWQLHHDPRNFEWPDDFVPERWASKSDIILNRSAYLPFLISMYSFVNLMDGNEEKCRLMVNIPCPNNCLESHLL
jgi:hypothetical protein